MCSLCHYEQSSNKHGCSRSLLGYTARHRRARAGHSVILFSVFWGIFTLIPTVAALVSSPSTVSECSSFSTSLLEFAHICAYKQHELGSGMSNKEKRRTWSRESWSPQEPSGCRWRLTFRACGWSMEKRGREINNVILLEWLKLSVELRCLKFHPPSFWGSWGS